MMELQIRNSGCWLMKHDERHSLCLKEKTERRPYHTDLAGGLILFALRITTGPLAIFEPRMGREPAAANTARPLPGVSLTNHAFFPCLMVTIRSKAVLFGRIRLRFDRPKNLRYLLVRENRCPSGYPDIPYVSESITRGQRISEERGRRLLET